jgi:uncharacterized membrane protein YdjX (TVP38/TMEM64 family)
VVPYIITALLLAVLIAVAGDELERYIGAVEAWVEGLEPWSIVVFVGLFAVLTSVLMPESLLSIAAGATFGLVWGAVAVVVASVLAAALQFALSRTFLRTRIQRALETRPSLAAIQRAVLHDELRLQLLLRVTPLNPAILSYVLGAAGVELRGFLVASLAMLPGALVEVYVGYASKHVARIASSDARVSHLHSLVVFGGLALCVVVMVLVSRVARKALRQSELDSEPVVG